MKTEQSMTTQTFDSSGQAICAMLQRVDRVEGENILLKDAVGRVIYESVRSDRPSPPCDLSAMDGYAVRLSDLKQPLLPVTGEVVTGRAPPPMPSGAVMRIFTGGPVPQSCDAVIPREHVEELGDMIRLPADFQVSLGQHIRRCGENAPAGRIIAERGVSVGPGAMSALAGCGIVQLRVHRRVRLSVIVTGNEVKDIAAGVEPWQIRDSNGPALEAMFASLPWIDWQGISHARDNEQQLKQVVAGAMADCDALLLTGGVSAGDYDYVPTMLQRIGCTIMFHKLPIRPGKPVLGAIGPEGQAVLGLPGNPVSTLTTARRLALPILRHCAGFAHALPPTMQVTLLNPDQNKLHLCWSRLVRLVGDGRAELVATQGSGDIIAVAQSDGFVELPPQGCGAGPWPFYRWGVNDG